MSSRTTKHAGVEMAIEWNNEQQRLKNDFSCWHDALSAEHVDRDRAGVFPRDKWEIICSSGLLRIPFEASWGGLGHDLLTVMYMLESLGYGCRDRGIAFSAVTHMVSTGIPLQRFGSPDLKTRYLPAICDGSAIGAHAISEPESGSDAMNMQTTAITNGEEFVLDGRKAFVSNGPVADLFTVYARTDPALGTFGISALLVERDTPGLTIGAPVEKMGLRTSPFCDLIFEGCRIPRENMVGKPGMGFMVFDHVMRWEILCSFAVAVGKMQYRLERCVEHAKTRVQFGQPIGSFQSIANKLVDMKIGLETSRKWLYDTAAQVDGPANTVVDVAITKLIASESDTASAMAAVQIFGGLGYVTGHGMEKDLRDAVAGTIYSGTSEIQRQRIAKMMGL